MEMNAPPLCPICRKPIPKRRYKTKTCGNLICVNRVKGNTMANNHTLGGVVGIANKEDFQIIRKALEGYFQENGHPKYPDRRWFEEYIKENNLCLGIKESVLKQAITTLLTRDGFGYIRLNGTSKGKKRAKFKYIGNPPEEVVSQLRQTVRRVCFNCGRQFDVDIRYVQRRGDQSFCGRGCWGMFRARQGILDAMVKGRQRRLR